MSRIIGLNELKSALNPVGFGIAIKETINEQARRTKPYAQSEIESRMTLRNRWTVNSIRVGLAKGSPRRIDSLSSEVGSIQPYLEVQEGGGVRRSTAGGADPVPTGEATGEGAGARLRRKLPVGRFRLRKIQLKSRVGASRKQRNAIAVKRAVADGTRIVYLHSARTKGIFRVRGGKKNPRLVMLYDLSERLHRIPKNPWLAPARERTITETPQIYQKNLLLQLRFRAKLGA